MSQRSSVWLAWGVWLVVVLAAALELDFRWLNDRSTLLIAGFTMLVYFAFVTVGALVVSRRPQNAIGWIFVAGALLGVAGELALEYAVYAVITAPGRLPGGAWAAWLGDWLRTVAFVLIITYVPLLFPDGRLPSPRWRLAAWLPLVGLALSAIIAVVTPSPNDERLQMVANPLGIGTSQVLSGLLNLLWILILAISVVLAAAAAVARFRRARGDERQQLKWFAYAATLAMGVTVFLLASVLVPPGLNGAVSSFLFALAFAGIPLATGLAILKYRLYDIDLIIRRTLVYTVLTALLALVYLVSVVAMQSAFTALTPLSGARAAGAARSELVTVLSTMAIAALFVPLRNRVQAIIDRRLYRRRYDAAKTLAEFSATLRDQVNLEELSERLLAVVDETMQPERVGLWLGGKREG